jgi:hypothetical protein
MQRPEICHPVQIDHTAGLQTGVQQHVLARTCSAHPQSPLCIEPITLV